MVLASSVLPRSSSSVVVASLVVLRFLFAVVGGVRTAGEVADASDAADAAVGIVVVVAVVVVGIVDV